MTDVSVGIVDPQPLIIEGMSTLFMRSGGFRIADSGSTPDHIVSIAERHQPDAMVIDLVMPETALPAISRASLVAPATKFLMYAAIPDPQHAMRALAAGAAGYVLKDGPGEDLLRAIESARRGEVYVTPCFAPKMVAAALQARVAQPPEPVRARFSIREEQILRLLLRGKRNGEIADALALSEKTVKGYMTNLMQKFNVRNRLEVVIAAQKLTPDAS